MDRNPLIPPSKLGIALATGGHPSIGATSTGTGTTSTVPTSQLSSVIHKPHASVEQNTKEIIAKRGYARRSFKLYYKKLLDVLGSLEDEPTNSGFQEIGKDAYSKLKLAFTKFETQHNLLLVIPDIKEDEVKEAEDLYEEHFHNFNEIEYRALKLIPTLREPEKLGPNPFAALQTSILDDVEMTDLGVRVSESQGYHTPLGPKTPKKEVPPQFRFRGTPNDMEEMDEPTRLLFQALTLNFRPSEHVTAFTGTDPLLYTAFRTAFEATERTMTRIGYTPYEKFLELKKCLKGEAQRLVQHLPNLDGSYETALKILDKYYLNPQMTTKRIMDQLSQLQKMGTSPESIKQFYCELNSIYQSLNCIGLVENELGRSLFLNIVIPKLNTTCCREFFKLTIIRKDPRSSIGHSVSIGDLMELILFQGQIAQQLKEVQTVQPTQTNFRTRYQNSTNLEKKPHENKTLFKTSQVKSNKTPMCTLCDKDHHVKDCDLIKTLEVRDLFNLARTRELCKLCFGKTHKTIDCRLAEKLRCKVCAKAHNSALHLPIKAMKKPKNTSNASVKTMNHPDPVGEFQAIPNILKAKLGNTEVMVQLDSGATISLVTKRMVEKAGLRLEPVKTPVSVRGVGSIPIATLQEQVHFSLSSLDGKENTGQITAYLVNTIDDNLEGLDFDPAEFNHLENYRSELTVSLPRNKIEIDVLLGEPWVTFLTDVPAQNRITNPNWTIPHPQIIRTKLGSFLGGGRITDMASYCPISCGNHWYSLDNPTNKKKCPLNQKKIT